MTKLGTAYQKVDKTLKSQDQGTCGLYSFWYAARLIENMISVPSGRSPIRLPRAYKTNVVSMRKQSKLLFKSAQGEILNAKEMIALAKENHYDMEEYSKKYDANAKKKFITESLNKDTPVLISYWAGNMPSGVVGPVTKGGKGAHWSVIISEDAQRYYFIEPNEPTHLKKCSKQDFLESNHQVGSVNVSRYWYKSRGRTSTAGPDVHEAKGGKSSIPTTAKSIYEVDPARAQDLGDVLLAVSQAA